MVESHSVLDIGFKQIPANLLGLIARDLFSFFTSEFFTEKLAAKKEKVT